MNINGTMQVSTEGYAVNSVTTNYDTGEQFLHHHGTFSTINEAAKCLAENLPAQIWNYANDQYFLPKERFAAIKKIYPEIDLITATDLGNSYQFQYLDFKRFPRLTLDQRLALAELCGLSFEGDDSGETFAVEQVALVPLREVELQDLRQGGHR